MKLLILVAVLFSYVQRGQFSKNAVVDLGPLLNFDDIETWEAPEETQRNFGYYVAGVDKEGRLVFIAEVGRWNFRKVIDEGGYEYEQMRRQIAKALWRSEQAVNGNFEKVAPGVEIRDAKQFSDGVGWIFDAEGFDYSQIASTKSLLFFFEVARTFSKLTDTIAYAQLVNTNFVVENLMNFIKPAFGAFSERVDVAGTNRERGNQLLLKRISKNQLPAWYGGSKESKPIAIYGK